jgi:DNA-binding NtrC family response regulator
MRGRHIVLVEDDADQRMMLADALTRAGYSVTQCEGAEEAIAVLQARQTDLLVADYQLGGATGTWLARVAGSSLSPAPRVMVITGHDRLTDAAGLTVLRKPFDADRLLQAVADLLAQPGRQAIAAPTQRVAFTLYVNKSALSQSTTRAVVDTLKRYNPDQIALTVVDLSEKPERAERDRILAIPTLLKTFPAPKIWLIGGGVPDELPHLLAVSGVEERT